MTTIAAKKAKDLHTVSEIPGGTKRVFSFIVNLPTA